MNSQTIRSIRYRLNLTQREFAQLLGMTQRGLAQWEKQGVRVALGARQVELLQWLDENYPTIFEQWLRLHIQELGPLGPYMKENKKD